jgi:hypothetical protein
VPSKDSNVVLGYSPAENFLDVGLTAGKSTAETVM